MCAVYLSMLTEAKQLVQPSEKPTCWNANDFFQYHNEFTFRILGKEKMETCVLLARIEKTISYKYK